MSARSIAYHNQHASGWSARYARGGFRRRSDFFETVVLSRLDLAGAWIDVGCGSGVFSRMLAARGAEVLGIDGSAAMIEAARSFDEPTASTPNVRFECRRIEDIPTVEPGFDGAICLSVIEYLDNPAASLQRMTAALKPGGTLVFSAPNARALVRRTQLGLRLAAGVAGRDIFSYLDSSRHGFSHAGLTALATDAGLLDVKILPFDPVLPRPFWAIAAPSLFFVLCRRAG